jgi:hypothetical protein
MLRHVALVRTDFSKELSVSSIRVIRNVELGTTLSVTSNRRTLLVTANVVPSPPILVTLIMEALTSSEMSVQEPHGVTSHKAVFFKVTAVKTSNHT